MHPIFIASREGISADDSEMSDSLKNAMNKQAQLGIANKINAMR